MAKRENEEVVRRGVEAWNSNDWKAIEAVMAPDGVVVAPQGWPEAGTFTGWPAVRAQLERIKEPWSEERIEILELESEADRALLQSRWVATGEGSGVDLDTALWVAYTFADGRVIRLEYFLEEGPARRAAGIEP
jgi:ketosteroid isomerase-like protein